MHKYCQGVTNVKLVQIFLIVSTTEHQQTWYQKNKEKCAEYNKEHALNSEYHESHKKSITEAPLV